MLVILVCWLALYLEIAQSTARGWIRFTRRVVRANENVRRPAITAESRDCGLVAEYQALQ